MLTELTADFHKAEYQCPAGKRAIHRFSSDEKGMQIHTYWSSACIGCTIKAQCTPSSCRIAREAHRGERDDFMVTMGHIRAACLKSDFEEDRIAVEASFAALLGIGEKDNEYICPFDLAPSEEAVLRKLADGRRQDALNAAEAQKSRPKEEREAVKRAEKSNTGPKGSLSTKPVKTPRLTPPRTAAELLAGL